MTTKSKKLEQVKKLKAQADKAQRQAEDLIDEMRLDVSTYVFDYAGRTLTELRDDLKAARRVMYGNT